jgi:hypothetical protein
MSFRHSTHSAFEAEDVHWLNSREAVNKAFEQAIAREDRCFPAHKQNQHAHTQFL